MGLFIFVVFLCFCLLPVAYFMWNRKNFPQGKQISYYGGYHNNIFHGKIVSNRPFYVKVLKSSTRNADSIEFVTKTRILKTELLSNPSSS